MGESECYLQSIEFSSSQWVEIQGDGKPEDMSHGPTGSQEEPGKLLAETLALVQCSGNCSLLTIRLFVEGNTSLSLLCEWVRKCKLRKVKEAQVLPGPRFHVVK